MTESFKALFEYISYNPKYIFPLHNINSYRRINMEVKYLALATINAIIQIK